MDGLRISAGRRRDVGWQDGCRRRGLGSRLGRCRARDRGGLTIDAADSCWLRSIRTSSGRALGDAGQCADRLRWGCQNLKRRSQRRLGLRKRLSDVQRIAGIHGRLVLFCPVAGAAGPSFIDVSAVTAVAAFANIGIGIGGMVGALSGGGLTDSGAAGIVSVGLTVAAGPEDSSAWVSALPKQSGVPRGGSVGGPPRDVRGRVGGVWVVSVEGCMARPSARLGPGV